MPRPYRTSAPRASAVLAAAFLVPALWAAPTLAHEFWIEAEDYTLQPGETLRADTRVGMRFKGNTQAFLPPRHTRFDIVSGDAVQPLASRIGDRPAVQQRVEGEGLAIVVHQATDTVLTYKDPAKFAQFVREEGLDGTLEAHAARGLPEDGFREVYSRHVKALVDLGPGGEDRALGLPIELVVEGDPYSEPMPSGVSVRALYNGEPMAGALLNVFAREADWEREQTEHTPIRLDDEGRATVPLVPGRRYLANVVKMREPDAGKAERTGAVWESLWASTTWSTERD